VRLGTVQQIQRQEIVVEDRGVIRDSVTPPDCIGFTVVGPDGEFVAHWVCRRSASPPEDFTVANLHACLERYEAQLGRPPVPFRPTLLP
jgi:hypothetical protein